MCNQAVGLVAAPAERRGVATVCVQLLEEVARAVRPPRSLLVPFRHGYPLGEPGRPELQRAVIEAALGLLEDPEHGPGAIARYRERTAGT